MDIDGGGGVDKFEFVIGYLKLSGKINYEKDILPLIHQFESMDVDHSGVLDDEELEIAAKKQTEIYESMKDDLNEKLQWAIFLNDYFYIKLYKIAKWFCYSSYQYCCKYHTNTNNNTEQTIDTNAIPIPVTMSTSSLPSKHGRGDDVV